jgi:hypothetical protein
MRWNVLKPSVLIVSVILILMIGLLASSTGLLAAGAQVIPGLGPRSTPLPVTPPARSNTVQDTRATSAAPAVVPAPGAPWLIPEPEFANAVLHWTSTSKMFQRSSLDPVNGELLMGEFWMHVGGDGEVLRYREQFTYPDGTLLQEVVYAHGTVMIILGPAYRSSLVDRCVVQHTSSGAWLVSAPPFAADGATLTQLGFEPRGGLTQRLPTTPILATAGLLESFPEDHGVTGWERRETVDMDSVLSRRLEIDAFGRIVASRGLLTDAGGTLIEETLQLFGALYIYEPTSVPDSVFSSSHQAQEACSE